MMMINSDTFNWRVKHLIGKIPPELAMVVQMELVLSIMVEAIQKANVYIGQYLERVAMRNKLVNTFINDIFHGEDLDSEEMKNLVIDRKELAKLVLIHKQDYQKEIRIYFYWAANIQNEYPWDNEFNDRFKAIADSGKFDFDPTGYYKPPTTSSVEFTFATYLHRLRADTETFSL